jgi:hypothetical protein
MSVRASPPRPRKVLGVALPPKLTDKSKGMLFLCALSIMHFVANAPVLEWGKAFPLPHGIELIDNVIPVAVWAGLWGFSGIGGVWAALYRPVWHKHQLKNFFQSLMVAMFTLWGAAYCLGYVLSPEPVTNRQWVVGCLYLSVAGLLFFWRRLVPVVPADEAAAEVPTSRTNGTG